MFGSISFIHSSPNFIHSSPNLSVNESMVFTHNNHIQNTVP